MGKRRTPKSQWASQGFERTGFSNWLDYNRNTDTLRYGTYDINPELVGLKRNRAKIDPSKIKSMDDVFRALGADQKAIDQYNAPQMFSWAHMMGGGGKPQRQVFTGADEWKNSAAHQLWAMVRPLSRQEQIYGGQRPTSIDSRDASSTQFVGNGMVGGTLIPQIGGARGMGGNSMGINIPSMQPKPTTYHKIFKGDDGMLNFEFGDLIPDDKAFAQKVSDMAWQLSKQGYNSRWGKDPGGVGKDPRANSSPVSQGKSPTILGG